MRLEEYWGIGPKTAETLAASIGIEAAVRAIEAGDVRTLVDAGVPSGRATRILRHVAGGAGLSVLATADARATYRDVIGHIRSFSLNQRAEDRVRLITPLLDPTTIEDRHAAVEAARETWRGFDPDTRQVVLETYAGAPDGGRERSAIAIARRLLDAGVTAGIFESLDTLEPERLERLETALTASSASGLTTGIDAELDAYRSDRETLESFRANPDALVERIRADGVSGTDEFREAFVEIVAAETEIAPTTIRSVAATDATDAQDFIVESLRSLAADRTDAIDERQAELEASVRETIETGRETIDRTVEVIESIGQWVTVARFAEHYDLTRPTIDPDREGVGIDAGRNLALVAADESVQPVTYGIGRHGIAGPPADDRVSVLTGANSGGKTTLLETLCQVCLLAQMGLPVPARSASVTVFESIVFHRRHASFNAGVLESTLQTIVPPVAAGGRTLMLVDEFEAITEPGSAAALLHGLVTMTVDRDALGVFVTHLADDLRPLPPTARIDGIFAEGLTSDHRLDVDYQPRFNEVGRSTPEFIVARLVAETDDRATRAAYESLAGALGRPVLQRTLADPAWAGKDA